ncbi:protein ELYS-like [Branchiostoma floridae x Branchiostoma belcheri]
MVKQVQSPSSTSALVQYSPATVECLESGAVRGDQGTPIFGAVCTGGQWAWLARGASLEVVNTQTGARQGAWCFGKTQKDPMVSISCVQEYEYQKSVKLVVGLQTGSGRGMVCLLDPNISKVIKAVDIPHKVTSVEPITNAGGIRTPKGFLSDQLYKFFFGIVAVGTAGGHAYLVDMAMDHEEESDEVNLSHLEVITMETRDLAAKRENALQRGRLFCLDITADCHRRGTFYYRTPDGKNINSFYSSNVAVSSLQFLKRTGTLAVGYNFGQFQLWRLAGPALDFSSNIENSTSAVTHFAYQEPENDPGNYCYLWVARGPLQTDPSEEVATSLLLYQMGYSRKETLLDSREVLYKELSTCGPTFQPSLGPMSEGPSPGSRLVSCYTLENHHSPEEGDRHEDSALEEEVLHGPDLSIAVFVWESPTVDPMSRSQCSLAVFDINRWYHAQMPVVFRLQEDLAEPCSFFSVFSLEDVMETASPDVMLDLFIDPLSISRFVSNVSPAPDQFYFPSALSFSTCCLMETGLVHCSFHGLQKKALSDLCKQGPSAMLTPHHHVGACLAAGLLPRNMEGSANMAVLHRVYSQGRAGKAGQHKTDKGEQTAQRETLLSVALDHNLVGFLTSCITQWAEGEYAHAGCTLRTVLDWAWNKVASIKFSLDKTCVPLYDGSGGILDQQTLQLLDHHALQLNHMVTVFHTLALQPAPTTEQGLKDLETKLTVVTLISQHLQVVLWFIRNKLLPECVEGYAPPMREEFCYKAATLAQNYRNRRAELARIVGPSGDSDLLLIDGMVSQVGEPITNLWERDEGGTGQYPPPSLRDLLDVYLLQNVDLMTKHCIVTYLILDILSMSQDPQQEKFSEQLGLFPNSFSLPLGVNKLIQGAWLLDHKDFEEALTVLLDPSVRAWLSPWQHQLIIKSFLYQGESGKALQYLRVSQPAMHGHEGVKLQLTVLLANGLTAEAIQFQQSYRDEGNTEELLEHLFLGCQQTFTVDKLLQLPFDDVEQKCLVKYLQESPEPNSAELLLVFYLQRGRFVDAVRLNDLLKQDVMMEHDAQAQQRSATRNAILETYMRLLPGVQRKLSFGPEQAAPRTQLMRREVSRPQPLSTVLHRGTEARVVSHATMLNLVLNKVAEARTQPYEPTTPFRRRHIGSPLVTENEPFVGTPVTPRSAPRVRETSRVIYPTLDEMVAEAQEETPVKHLVSPGRRPRTSPVGLLERLRRHTMNLGADALSLLSTPPVKRRRASYTQHLPEAAPQRTPPSILKVRKAVRKSVSPQREAKARQATGSISDFAMPTPPRYQRRTIGFAEPPKEQKETPRKIRFAAETPGLPPSPDIEKSSPLQFEPPCFDEEREASPDRASLEAVAEDDAVAMETMEVDEEITFNLSRGDGLADDEEMEDTQEFVASVRPSPPKPPSPVSQLSPGLYPDLPEPELTKPDQLSPFKAQQYPGLSPQFHMPDSGDGNVPSDTVSAWAPWGSSLSRAPLQRGSAPPPATSDTSQGVHVGQAGMETTAATGTLDYPSPPKPMRLLLSPATMTPPDTPESASRLLAKPATTELASQHGHVSPVKLEPTPEVSVPESTASVAAEEESEVQEPATQLPSAVVMEEAPGLTETKATPIEAATPLVEPSAVVMEEAPGLVETQATAMEADSTLDEPPKPVSPQVIQLAETSSNLTNISVSVEEESKPSNLAEKIVQPQLTEQASSKEITVSTVVETESKVATPTVSTSEPTQSPRKPSPVKEAAPLAEPSSSVDDTPMRGQVTGVEQFKRSLRTRSRSPLKATRRSSSEGGLETEGRSERRVTRASIATNKTFTEIGTQYPTPAPLKTAAVSELRAAEVRVKSEPQELPQQDREEDREQTLRLSTDSEPEDTTTFTKVKVKQEVPEPESHYVFSPPVTMVPRSEQRGKDHSTPAQVPNFVFSPPLTRSRGRSSIAPAAPTSTGRSHRSVRKTRKDASPVQTPRVEEVATSPTAASPVPATPPPMEAVESPESVLRSGRVVKKETPVKSPTGYPHRKPRGGRKAATTRTRMKKPKLPHVEPSDSPISFISPVPEESPATRTRSRRRVVKNQPHPMSLRQKKAPKI